MDPCRKLLRFTQHNILKLAAHKKHIGSQSANKNMAPKLPTPDEQIAKQKTLNREAGQMTELVRDFLDPAAFFASVSQIGIDFYCGVPDSLLKDFCAFVTSNVAPSNHVITVNEGSAIALAAGYHLSTGKYGMVYFQNSGLGNAVNPLMSLAARNVYNIPMLLLVGWRGEPGKRDEPQHLVQGEATPGLLAGLGIPFQILPDYQDGADEVLQAAKYHMRNSGGPYALLVRRQTFTPFKTSQRDEQAFPLNRECALKAIIDCLGDRDVVIASTGMLSRELFEHRGAKGQSHERDFLTVGSMGHASAIALGVSMFRPERRVFCIDGDGSALMHMGILGTIGDNAPPNFKHIIINNGAHDSVGGQPTVAGDHQGFSFPDIAEGCGYRKTYVAADRSQVTEYVKEMGNVAGPVLLEVKVAKGGRSDLGRPTRTPVATKTDFMRFLTPL